MILERQDFAMFSTFFGIINVAWEKLQKQAPRQDGARPEPFCRTAKQKAGNA
jgi:hypothetical protein